MQPLILVTNDDGIYSPGLHAAAEAVAPLGELLIVAPRHQQTAMSRSLPSGPEYGIIEEIELEILGQPRRAYAVYGSPALAVVHGVMEIAPRQPALCVSGINYGENIGMTISVSGTVGAALEASVLGIPALAVSTETDMSMHHSANYGEVDWSAARHFTGVFARRILENGLPPEVSVININVPRTATPETEVRVTRQSHQAYYYYTKPEKRPFNTGFRVRVTNTVDPAKVEPDSDIQAFVFDRVVSVTPLTGNMTAPVDLAGWSRMFLNGSRGDSSKG
ncbi:MAG: 5'/3'-nucleotidase SurE [Chloroflexota bacterium]